MPTNWTYFRDLIVINQDFANFISANTSGLPQGSTLFIAGRICQHEAGYSFRVPPGFNLVLAADQYDAAGGSIDASGVAATGQGAAGGPGQNSTGEIRLAPGNPGGAGPEKEAMAQPSPSLPNSSSTRIL